MKLPATNEILHPTLRGLMLKSTLPIAFVALRSFEGAWVFNDESRAILGVVCLAAIASIFVLSRD